MRSSLKICPLLMTFKTTTVGYSHLTMPKLFASMLLYSPFALLLLLGTPCSSFQPHYGTTVRPTAAAAGTTTTTTTLLRAESSPDLSQDLLIVKNYLKEHYPSISLLLEKNDVVWKALGGAEGGGFTIFAPNAAAFQNLGDTKQGQLQDIRNLETTEKMGAYHVIAEVVTADQLFNAGGVVTLGGDVMIDRSVSGGMFGMGGKEDGGVTVNGAKVVQSLELGSGVLHEVDDLIAPNVLWRYMDQLRIPGSN
jgi:hypothetical protein